MFHQIYDPLCLIPLRYVLKFSFHLPSGLPCDLYVGGLLINLSWLMSQETNINKIKVSENAHRRFKFFMMAVHDFVSCGTEIC